jgi:hypothetical protein
MSFRGSEGLPESKGPEESVELPAKLSALAEQLGDDADSLALRYPAPDRCGRAAFEIAIAEALCADGHDLVDNNIGSEDRREVRAPAGEMVAGWGMVVRWRMVACACAAMVVVAVASWEGAVRFWKSGEQPPSAAARVLNPVDSVRSEQGISGEAALPREAMLLRGLSAAEQEAVLDLLEHGPEQSVSLSI